MEALFMNKYRAKEISQSPIMKHVTFNGQQVYIQHVDEQTEVAHIYPLDDPENEFSVQISQLKEHGRGKV